MGFIKTKSTEQDSIWTIYEISMLTVIFLQINFFYKKHIFISKTLYLPALKLIMGFSASIVDMKADNLQRFFFPKQSPFGRPLSLFFFFLFLKIVFINGRLSWKKENGYWPQLLCGILSLVLVAKLTSIWQPP